MDAMDYYDYSIHDYPISTMEQLAEGAWPLDPLDPKCKFAPATPESMGNLALTCFEGLMVAGDYIMGDRLGGFANRASKGERIGGASEIILIDGELNAAGKWDGKSGTGRSYGGHTQSHYGQGQERLFGAVKRSKGLPGWVIWTSHERFAEKARVIGPASIGEAGVANTPLHFGNTLHFVTAECQKKQVDPHTQKSISVIDVEYRIHTRKHFQAEGTVLVPCLAVSRVDHPDMMPSFLTSDVPGESIQEFYRIVEKSKEKSKAGLVRPSAA